MLEYLQQFAAQAEKAATLNYVTKGLTKDEYAKVNAILSKFHYPIAAAGQHSCSGCVLHTYKLIYRCLKENNLLEK